MSSGPIEIFEIFFILHILIKNSYKEKLSRHVVNSIVADDESAAKAHLLVE